MHVFKKSIISERDFKKQVLTDQNNIYAKRTLRNMQFLTIEVRAFPWKYCTSNISNTRNSVSLGYLNTEKRVENTTRSGVFLTKFEVFG